MPAKIFSIMLTFMLILCGCSEVTENYNQANPLPDDVPSEAIYNPPASSTEISVFAVRPDTLNPLMTKYSVNRNMLSLIFEPLFTTTQAFEINPRLAESYEIKEGATEIVINLRQGVKWHDGSDFTSADVDYTIKQIFNAKEECAYFKNLEKVSASNPNGRYSYKFTLSEPDSGFVHLLDFPIIKNNSAEALEANEKIIGTGMYAYSSADIYKSIYLVRNDAWWGQEVNIPSVTVNLMPDVDSSYNGFKMNSIDTVIADNITGSKYDTNANISYLKSNTNLYSFLSLNHSNKLLADVGLRKILKKILCSEKITTDLLPEYSVLCDSPVNPAASYAVTDEDTPETDIKEELQAAGYKMGRNGFRTYETDGYNYMLDFDLLICSDNPVRSIVGEYIKSTLLMYGISVNIIEKTADEYTQAAYSGKYDMVLCETRIGLNYDLSQLIGSGGSVNIGGYSSEAADEVILSLKTAETLESRKAAFLSVQEIFKNEMPHIPLYFSVNKIMYNDNVIAGVSAGDINYEYSNLNGWTLSSGKDNNNA